MFLKNPYKENLCLLLDARLALKDYCFTQQIHNICRDIFLKLYHNTQSMFGITISKFSFLHSFTKHLTQPSKKKKRKENYTLIACALIFYELWWLVKLSNSFILFDQLYSVRSINLNLINKLNCDNLPIKIQVKCFTNLIIKVEE